MTLTIGSLCSGYGGLDQAVQAVLGGELAFVADPDPGATRILAHHHPDVSNLGDITRVDWATVPAVDILTAGFPCQPVSLSGLHAGITDERWLFDDITRALRDMVTPPRLCLFENVPGLLTASGGHAMARVVEGLASVGYVGTYRVLAAADAGAPHKRERVFILAWPAASDPADLGYHRARPARPWRHGPAHRDSSAFEWGEYADAIRRWERVLGRPAPVPAEPRDGGHPRLSARFAEWLMGVSEGWVTAVPGLSWSAQVRALGNGVVPQQGALALRLLLERVTAVAA